MSDELKAAIAEGQAAVDPISVLREHVHEEGSISRDVLQQVAQNLKTHLQRGEYAALLTRLSDGETRGFGLHRLASNLLEHGSFEEATRFAENARLSPDEQNSFAVALATERIGAGTPRLADWLLSHSSEQHLTTNIEKLINAWTRADFNSAATWLGDLEPSPARDTAVTVFAPLVAKEDPAAAFEWGVTIGGADARRRALEKVMREWLNAAPGDAEAAVAASNLTEREKVQLLKIGQRERSN